LSAARILLVGAGGHARACIDVIESGGQFEIGGLVGLPEQAGGSVLGYPVVGTDGDLRSLYGEFSYALVTVGQIKSPDLRIALYTRLREIGYGLPRIVSPHAHVSRHAEIAEGTIVMHGAIVNAAAAVGCNCILNSQSLVEHDCVVGNHCHIATTAALNSGVRIGDGTFVGSHSSVRQGTRIGERCVIGMGQRVLADCAPGAWLPGKAAPA
jgi:sugar O-acyltransferase (sialic acid O-acetyltransferase NeuD family)